MDTTQQYKVRTLALILGLGALIGITDPWFSGELHPITVFPTVGGSMLLLVLAYLLISKNVRNSMFGSVAATALVTLGCFTSYGDPFYVMLGFAVPVAAALFMKTSDACWILGGYCFSAVLIATAIHLKWIEPQHMSESASTALGLKQTVTGVSIILAMTVTAIWRERLFADPTERENLQQSRFETICDHGYDAIIQADDKGNISFCSGHLVREFGFRLEQLRNRQQLSFITRGARREFLSNVKRSGGRYQFDQETTIFDANGDPRWVRVSGGSFEDSFNNRHWVYGIRAIEEQVRQREQLYEVARMESLGSVCAGLAHDFNNLLTVIGLHAELVRNESTRRNILRAQQQATRLTSGLLTFARKQEFREQRITLSKFFNDSSSLIGKIVPGSIKLKWEIDDDDVVVKVDPAQMQQVLVNLVTNSQYAMPAGGEILVSAKKVDVLPDACLEESNPGKSYVAISVRDSGSGMTADVVRRAIEPFFTTKPRGKGTGLGLAMVHGIVRRAGGFLTIDSRRGHGTEISIFLPALLQKDESAAAIPDAMAKTPEIAAKVLVVEDQELVANSISMTLELAGAEVVLAGNAEDGLELIESDTSYDLIISDLVLPGRSGVELIQSALQKLPDVNAILISGHHQENLDFLKRNSARVSFLAKPFSVTSLLQLVRSSCQNKAMHIDEPQRS